ncbi:MULTISPECIES: tail fiber protein [unclassified Ensifer]|uniref:tail fiber protein n=1 Tax=unclassified Ensifer TaxID=2633371 RepID=UPI000813416C|nr:MULTISPECIES: tail fiber protein [unclassified Ensifer]OCO98930.1 hypothetical protein BC362_27200 [Ensifer sp. LC14]OCP04465.1 hypothetical protein BBX50_25835 [Ensifer sp. LC11]OCP04744.1 hypothetical protein BC374_25845 [Ensifer sp. LC13]OCP30568.1 hypothetical protein BC364_25860 [Ensifer sp. LC499]
MPRTGGVFSPPAGTKGVPNTTIQSVPYNTLIDDLTADANAPRPVTAGGTGATSASGARTALGVEIGANVQAYDAGLQSIAGLTTTPHQMLYTTGSDLYATTALTPFARSILDDVDAAAAKETLGLAAVASSGSASDLTTGTIADARLPSTQAGKTFNTTACIRVGAATSQNDYLLLQPTDVGAGKPSLFFQKSTTAGNWVAGLWDGVTSNVGNLNFVANSVSVNGNQIATLNGATFTGAVLAGPIVSTNGEVIVRSSGNRHLWLRNAADVNRGLVYHDNASGSIGSLLYNTSGAFVRAFYLREDGVMEWGGHRQTIDGRTTGGSETRWYADNNSHFRYIFGSDNTFNFQWSSDFYQSSFRTIMRGDSSFNILFDGAPALYAKKMLMHGAAGGGDNGIRVGSGDGASFDTQNIQIVSWWGIGLTSSIDNTTRIVMDPRVGTISTMGQVNIGSASHFTDGNIQFSGGMGAYGAYLSTALDTAQWRAQSWQNVSGSRSAGTSYQNTTGRPIMVSVYGNDGSEFQVSSNNSNWLTIGYSDVDQDNGGATTAGVIIPHGWYYRLINNSQQNPFWNELR